MSRAFYGHAWRPATATPGRYSSGGAHGGMVDECEHCGVRRFKSNGKRLYATKGRVPSSTSPACTNRPGKVR